MSQFRCGLISCGGQPDPVEPHPDSHARENVGGHRERIWASRDWRCSGGNTAGCRKGDEPRVHVLELINGLNSIVKRPKETAGNWTVSSSPRRPDRPSLHPDQHGARRNHHCCRREALSPACALEEPDGVEEQIVFADRILVNKIDFVTKEFPYEVEAEIHNVNKVAKLPDRHV